METFIIADTVRHAVESGVFQRVNLLVNIYLSKLYWSIKLAYTQMYLDFGLSFGVLVGDFHYRPCVITMVSVSSSYYIIIL